MFDHCLYFNTTALARVVEREWAAAFKPFGLTPPQGFLLRMVLARPGLSQHELASELTIARPTATRLLDGLQALGLVERRDAEHDARHWAVFPTAAAQKIHADLNAASGQVTQRIQRQIGKENFTDTVSKVRGVCSALK
ncbi:MAG: MarR family winged helix-turn-helix transcriptional regulator [Polaromonas sp.]|jgi:DNA-binding MarR family transcriptional regulator